jgi:hypothetical protein
LVPEPRVPTLLYIGKRGRVTKRAIGLTDCVPGLLQQIDPSYLLDTPASATLALAGLPLDGCWADSLAVVIYTGGASTPDPYL